MQAGTLTDALQECQASTQFPALPEFPALTEFPAKAGTSTENGAKAAVMARQFRGASAPQWFEVPALSTLGREFTDIAN
jgi:hypothetical protein